MSERLTPDFNQSYKIEGDRPKEECGVFGIRYFNPSEPTPIGRLALIGNHSNQHRGEESAGVVIARNGSLSPAYTRMGSIKDLYREVNDTDMSGYAAVSHTRYSTTGSSCIENAGPMRFESPELGPISIAHNGQINNAGELRKELESQGVVFDTTTDSEVIGYTYLYAPGKNWDQKIRSGTQKLSDSFSLAVLTPDALYAVRSKTGNRPLSYARFEKDGRTGYAVSSETPAFDMLDLHYKRDVNPGEIIKFEEGGITSMPFSEPNEAFCGLEVTYLMRPDSLLKKIPVAALRRHLGETLAALHPPEGQIDLVTFIPESAKYGAEGYAKKLSEMQNRYIPLYNTLLKNRYGAITNGRMRGFTSPSEEERERIAKSYSLTTDIEGKRIVVVDDSIIRGVTTSGVLQTIKRGVQEIKRRGPKHIEIAILFPEAISRCPLGTDIDEDLVALNHPDIVERAHFLGANRLTYLRTSEFENAVNEMINLQLCMGCTTGEYPIPILDNRKDIFEQNP